ncbi:hypothetical protein ACFQV7_03230 [Leucobacter soli]|uniref:hypothetical protein n=1 Tax=Leucobacter soli TaxID=2812850 RepID=UPI003614605A
MSRRHLERAGRRGLVVELGDLGIRLRPVRTAEGTGTAEGTVEHIRLLCIGDRARLERGIEGAVAAGLILAAEELVDRVDRVRRAISGTARAVLRVLLTPRGGAAPPWQASRIGCSPSSGRSSTSKSGVCPRLPRRPAPGASASGAASGIVAPKR